jgi:CRP-like cAMP-binding protein
VVLPAAGVSAAFRTGSRTFSHAFRAVFEDLTLARRFGPGYGAPSTSERVADVLLDLAQRFGVEDGTGLRIELRLTHQTLADLAGAHRSTVTTLVNDWMYRRILKDTDPGLLVRHKRLSKHASGHGRGAEIGDQTTSQRR